MQVLSPASDWFRDCCEFSELITKRSKTKRNKEKTIIHWAYFKIQSKIVAVGVSLNQRKLS